MKEAKRKPIHRTIGYAFEGLWEMLLTEHNARLHLMSTAGVLGLIFWLRPEPVKFCILILAITTVWVAEAFNTCIELLTDLISPGHSRAIKTVKDIAAAAVFIAAMGSLVLGVVILGPLLYGRLVR
jgi:diacylglycerol kinase